MDKMDRLTELTDRILETSPATSVDEAREIARRWMAL